MALKSKLTLWAYPSPSGQVIAPAVAYGAELESLQFTTVSPGGYGQLTAHIKLANPRLPRPELDLFSRVALVGKGKYAFLGEIYDTTYSGNAAGEIVTIKALGVGASLRDDPRVVAYAGKTAPFIAADQIGFLVNNNLPVAQDTTALFPDNPATTYAQLAYDERTAEEILQDIATLAGDYTTVTWDHPTARDAAGFPAGQAQVHQRDKSTTTYQALITGTAEVVAWDVGRSADRAYNFIEVRYNDGGTGGGGSALAADPRLNIVGGVLLGQGTAPYRFRKFVRDLRGITTVNAAMAQTVANTYLAQMKDPPAKVQLTLKAARDGNGNGVELYELRADGNIFVPDLAVRGAQLATGPTPGTNQFYILQTTYIEDQAGAKVELVCDNYYDAAAVVISRLQLLADRVARNGGSTTGDVQALGSPLTVPWGASEYTVQNGMQIGSALIFPRPLAQAPSSLTFSATTSNNVASGPSFNNLGIFGANVWIVNNLINTQTYWFGRVTTVGNCLLGVDAETGRFSWHCDGCGEVHEGLDMRRALTHGPALHHDPHHALAPGMTHLSLHCPTCGPDFVEGFNTGLREADEDETLPGNWHHRAEQARLIRQLMAHPLVGLRRHGDRE